MVVAAAQSSAQSYKAPKTPWGDPDIQGNYTQSHRGGHAARATEGIRGQATQRDHRLRNWRTLKRQAAEQTIRQLPRTDRGAGQLVAGGVPQRENGAQAWLVIDPPDGKIPPLTPEAQQRQRPPPRRGSGTPAARPTPTTTAASTTAASRAASRLDDAGDLRQLVPDRAGPGYVAITYEMIHETRIIPLDGRPARRQGHPTRHGRRARPLGRRHARRRDDELPRAQRLPQRQPGQLKITERFTPRRADTLRVDGDRRRSDDVDEAVDVLDAADPGPTEPLLPYECHEGNYGLKNILSAARADDAKAAAASQSSQP